MTCPDAAKSLKFFLFLFLNHQRCARRPFGILSHLMTSLLPPPSVNIPTLRRLVYISIPQLHPTTICPQLLLINTSHPSHFGLSCRSLNSNLHSTIWPHKHFIYIWTICSPSSCPLPASKEQLVNKGKRRVVLMQSSQVWHHMRPKVLHRWQTTWSTPATNQSLNLPIFTTSVYTRPEFFISFHSVKSDLWFSIWHDKNHKRLGIDFCGHSTTPTHPKRRLFFSSKRHIFLYKSSP